MADIALNPSFPENEIELTRESALHVVSAWASENA